MTELGPKWSPFHVLWDDLHIVGDTPYRFGVIRLWIWQNLGNVKIGFNLGAHIFRSDYAIMTKLAPKWSPFHLLCDDLHIIGDTPYRFGPIQLWSWLYYEGHKTQSPVSPQQRRQWWWDSHQNDTFYILSDDTNIAGDIPYRLIWSYMALTSTMFLQYRNTQSPVSLEVRKQYCKVVRVEAWKVCLW